LNTSKKKPPKGIYLVAIVFLVSGLICMAQFLNVVFGAFGVEGLSLSNSKWIVTGYGLAFCLVCCGVALLTRLHPLPQWLMFGMTVLLTVQMIAWPARDSPLYSAQRIYLNRALMVLPMVASCVYLLRPRFRAACRTFRATDV
jgi:intracellular septation protein A